MGGIFLLVMSRAASTTLCSATSQDTLNSAPVEITEYPGFHVDPPQPAGIKEPLFTEESICMVESSEKSVHVSLSLYYFPSKTVAKVYNKQLRSNIICSMFHTVSDVLKTY